MIRGLIPALLCGAFVSPAPGQHVSRDPAFDKVPFDQWLAERDQARLRWTVAVSRPELSFHQRLIAGIEIKVDGRDLESRRGDGRLVFFVQITGPGGTPYQSHGEVELAKLDENIKAANLEYAQTVFVLPGDYRLAAAILDTATGEHSTRQSQFRVPSPQRDLLRDAWRGLPPVEFIGAQEAPESWYLPDIQTRLQWASTLRSPATLNVVLNVAVSPPATGSRRRPTGELPALLPTLKAISQTGASTLAEHVEVLDLSRRRTVFQHDGANGLDWSRLKAALQQSNTASIDIRSLSESRHDAQFFVSQISRLLRASKEPCVLVVLTPPVAFEPGEDLTPITGEGLSNCRVVYIRYRPAARQALQLLGGPMAGRRQTAGGPMYRNRMAVIDELESTLKPLRPKTFDVETPDDMTRAFIEIRKLLDSSPQ